MMHALLTLALLVAAPHDPKADPPGKNRLELTLKHSALARGVDVKVGELCDITPVGADALAIGDLRFGPAPVPGFVRKVTRMQLLQTLVAAGHAADSFRFKGAVEATIQAVVLDVSAQRIVDEATNVLRAVLAHEGGDVELEVVDRVRPVRAPAGHKSQELRARVRGARTNPASAVVDVEILVDDQVAQSVPVQFKLTRFHQLLRTTATIPAGTPLGPHNLRISREATANTPGLYIGSFDDVDGLIARRNLTPNRLVGLGDVGPPAVIRRGELVDVIMTRGRVKVMVRAIANKDAALGETLTVTNTQSRRQITGIAAASGTVVVPTGR